MLPQNAQPDDVCGHARQSKSSLMIVGDILQADEENEEMAVEGDAEVPAPAADHEEPCPDCGQRFKLQVLNFWQDPREKYFLIHHSISLFSSVDSNLLTS